MEGEIKVFIFIFIWIWTVLSVIDTVRWFIAFRNEQKFKDKDSIFRFLQSQIPNPVTISEIAEYSGFSFLKTSDLLHELVKDKLVQEGGFTLIFPKSGNKHCSSKPYLFSVPKNE